MLFQKPFKFQLSTTLAVIFTIIQTVISLQVYVWLSRYYWWPYRFNKMVIVCTNSASTTKDYRIPYNTWCRIFTVFYFFELDCC